MLIDDFATDYRPMTRGRAPVNWARACGFCRALIASNRSYCLACGKRAPATNSYQQARAAMDVAMELGGIHKPI